MHDCILSLPMVVFGALIVGGNELAMNTAIAGAASLVNMQLSVRAGSALVRAAATGHGAPMAIHNLVLKHLLLLGLTVVLAGIVGPLAVLLAFTLPFWSALLHAAVNVVLRIEARAVARGHGLLQPLSLRESGC